MGDQGVVVLGIPLPSSSTFFLVIVAVHVATGLTCVVSGAVAMLSPKRRGRHPTAGKVYFWSLAVVFVSMGILSILRWPADNHLLVLGILSFATALVGRTARRRQWRGWARHHIAGMGRTDLSGGRCHMCCIGWVRACLACPSYCGHWRGIRSLELPARRSAWAAPPRRRRQVVDQPGWRSLPSRLERGSQSTRQRQ